MAVINRKKMEKKIQEVADKIVQEFQPEKIILFGSWAWGEPTEDSDVDLFVVKETTDNRKTAMEIDGSIFPRPFPMDLFVYTPNQLKKELSFEEPFITKVSKKGMLLYEKKSS
ncbi:MAG: nucleotidyltransferase domain-containing protein [Candidatus Moraniibacteriota bacterium]|jgi:predicted nucleotidyltransferase